LCDNSVIAFVGRRIRYEKMVYYVQIML
jgi:hypothetical protein